MLVKSSTSSTPLPSSSTASEWDHVVTFFADGSVGVVEVSNVSNSPVKCVQQRPVHFHPGLNFNATDARSLSKATCLRHFMLPANPSIATEEDDRPASLTLIGTNASSGDMSIVELPLSMLRRPAPHGGRTRLWRCRPTSKISKMARSTNGRFTVTLSERTLSNPAQEVVLWQSKSKDAEVLRQVPLASARLSDVIDPAVDAACSGSACYLLHRSGKLSLWRRRPDRKRPYRLEWSKDLDTEGAVPMEVEAFEDPDDVSSLFALAADGSLKVWTAPVGSQEMPTKPTLRATAHEGSSISFTLQKAPRVVRNVGGVLHFAALSSNDLDPWRHLIHKRENVVGTAICGDYIALGQCSDICDIYSTAPNKRSAAASTSKGIEISIWDAAESEFNSGLEWAHAFECVSTSLFLSCMSSSSVILGRRHHSYLSTGVAHPSDNLFSPSAFPRESSLHHILGEITFTRSPCGHPLHRQAHRPAWSLMVPCGNPLACSLPAQDLA